MRGVATVVLLAGLLWAALSGHYSTEPMIFGFGVLSLAIVGWIVYRMDREAGMPGLPEGILGLVVRMPVYGLYLMVKIVQANLRVARLLFDPRVTIKPRLLRVRARQRTELGRVIYANSITLTPGTVTLDLRGDELLVHALGPISAGSVVSGEMDRAVRRYEGGG